MLRTVVLRVFAACRRPVNRSQADGGVLRTECDMSGQREQTVPPPPEYHVMYCHTAIHA